HLCAAEAAARTGSPYDPDNPSEATIIRVVPRSPDEIAAELKLPWVNADRETMMHPAVGWLVTCLTGSMIGISVGLLGGFLQPDAPHRRLPALIACILGGIAVATVTKYAVRQAFQRPSERWYLGHSFANWMPFAIFAVLLAAAFVRIDATVEKE